MILQLCVFHSPFYLPIIDEYAVKISYEHWKQKYYFFFSIFSKNYKPQKYRGFIGMEHNVVTKY